MSRGQSLVELAVCAPVIVLLTLGAAAIVEIVDARAGLEAATRAAADEAARAPDPISAERAAQDSFASTVAAYPLRSATLRITFGGFNRADRVVASATGLIDLSWAAMVVPGRLTLDSRVEIPLEAWRTHALQQ
ncbi:MAG: TadE/TadG family type IV pilus assembly protein [Candidatus Dormiibacterota bacterium]